MYSDEHEAVYLASVLHRLTPEVGPWYVVPDSSLPTRLERLGGFTNPFLCWQLQPYIRPWCGPRPCFVLCGQIGPHRLPTALHEAAHCLQAGPPYCSPTPPDWLAEVPVKTWLADLDASAGTQPVRWAGHDVEWVRACVVLWQAAVRAGHEVRLVDVCNTPFYGLRPVEHYLAATPAEDLRPGRRITDVLATPMPAALRLMFEEDTGQACEHAEGHLAAAAAVRPGRLPLLADAEDQALGLQALDLLLKFVPGGRAKPAAPQPAGPSRGGRSRWPFSPFFGGLPTWC